MFQRTIAGVPLRLILAFLSLTFFSSSLLTAQTGDTLLAVAAREGDVAEVRRLLEAGADPEVGFEGYTPLMLAAMNGEPEVARLLLDHGALINNYDSENGTPLCVASFSPFGSDEVVMLLLERGGETEVGNGTDMTPLMYAAREGKVETVRILLEAGANASHTDVRGWSPIMFGVRSGNPNIVRMILAAGADPNVGTDYPTRRPLHYVAETGDTTIASILLESGADIDGGRTIEEVPPPVAIAAINGNFDLVRFFVRHDARLNRSFIHYPEDGTLSSESGAATLLDIVEAADEEVLAQEVRDSMGVGYRELQTLVGDMHDMVKRGNVEGIDHALRLGLDPAAWIEVGDESLSLLDIAYTSGDSTVIGHLLDATDLDYWNLSYTLEQQEVIGREDLVYVTVRHAPLVGLLYGIERTNDHVIDLALGWVDPEDVASYGVRDLGTALHVSVAVGDLPTLERIFELGVPIDVRTERGETPLHIAVWNDNQFMVEWLLENGAAVDAITRDGETPLILGARNGSISVIPALLAAGAEPNARDRRWGQTPLHYSVKEGDAEMTGLLITGGADPDLIDYRGQSPRDLARMSGNLGLIDISGAE